MIYMVDLVCQTDDYDLPLQFLLNTGQDRALEDVEADADEQQGDGNNDDNHDNNNKKTIIIK